jgi:carboxyl-terminal processing protease
MKKKIKWILLSGALLLVIFGFAGTQGDIYFEISKNLDLFGKVYKEISFNYVEEIDPEQFMRAGIEGMLSSLDPYTIFIDEKKKEDIDLITDGKYGGIGVSIGVRGEDVTIVEVMDGYSAQKQGIEVGDILIEAAGVKISADNVDQISSLVKGEPGTTVNLKVIRNDMLDTLTFNIVREEVLIKNITYYGFYPENSNNVYIKLTNFSRSAADELKYSLKELKDQKEINSIVLDLRGNPGGLLDIAVDICDKFLKKDLLIVSTKGRVANTEKKYNSVEEPLVGDTKLVVLINGGSASASEIVAGAMQDHDRGVILGTKSFGKGLVQTILPLNYNTSLKITTAKYYTPSGRCIQKIDYAENNDVIKDDSLGQNTEFFTDNNREVYSKGGITPDTTVQYLIEGDLTKELLAKGMFFKFANLYSYSNPDFDFDKINESKILKEFEKYLDEQKYEYKSRAEKEVDQLIGDIADKDNNLSDHLKSLKSQLANLYKSEFKIYSDEIAREIKVELAARFLGPDGKVIEQLKYDPQVQAAVNILKDQKTYNRLLHVN